LKLNARRGAAQFFRTRDFESTFGDWFSMLIKVSEPAFKAR